VLFILLTARFVWLSFVETTWNGSVTCVGWGITVSQWHFLPHYKKELKCHWIGFLWLKT